MIRTRFAPSPTGLLHVGGLRTALFNFLFARHQKGIFVLRIEDTDKDREMSGATEKIIFVLETFGLNPDEGPGINDLKFGPYLQSERLELYKKYAQHLVESDEAYFCFCTSERLEQLRTIQVSKKQPPKYDGLCRKLTSEEIERNLTQKKSYVIRQKVPQSGLTEFIDEIYGELKFKNNLLDDSVLQKSDGYPVYNFANVIDDHLMEISHIIRGEEFLSSTPKHVLLYKAFGWDLPVFAHLPLILDTQRKKLSKRTSDVAVEEYLNKGYLKEALLNFIALLGWNPKTTQEIFSLEELIAVFKLENINKSSAIFDIAKLDYFNREWRKLLKSDVSQTEIADPLQNRYYELVKSRSKKSEKFDKRLADLVWPQVLERISGPSDLEQKLLEFDFYYRLPDYSIELLVWKKMTYDQTRSNLKDMRDYLEKLTIADLDKKTVEEKIKKFLKEKGVKMGEALWPLRVALSGQKNSPSPFEIIEVLVNNKQKNVILERIEVAIQKLT